MTTYLEKSCSFGLPRVPFVNCRQFMYLEYFLNSEFYKMLSCILYHYSKLLYKKLSHAQRILTLLLRDMVVNPMFPKRSILIDCRFGKSCRE